MYIHGSIEYWSTELLFRLHGKITSWLQLRSLPIRTVWQWTACKVCTAYTSIGLDLQKNTGLQHTWKQKQIFIQNQISYKLETYTAKTKYRNFETNIPRAGISGFQSQFPYSCVCEWFIYVEIRAEAALFPEKEYISGIFVSVYPLHHILRPNYWT